MTGEKILGACGSCAKTFRVPQAGKKYRCKACGGVVLAPIPPEDSAPNPPEKPHLDQPCEACDALNPPDARFCEECGEPLGEEGSPRSRTGPRSRDRVAASGDLKRARKVIGIVRFAFGIQAVAGALFLLWLYQLLLRSDPSALPEGVWVPACIMTLSLAISVTGFLRVTLEPFLWAVLLAFLMTLRFVLTYSAVGMHTVSLLTWVVLAWCLVPATVRVRRILKEHPDTYGVQALQGTTDQARIRKRRRGGLTQDDADELAQTARKQLMQRTVVALTLVFGVSGGLAALVWSRLPPSFDEFLAATVKEWNAGDLERLSKRFVKKDRGTSSWDRLRVGPIAQDLPPLGEPLDKSATSSRGQVAWETDRGRVEMIARVREGDWVITGLVPPLPPIGDLPHRLRSSWNTEGVRAVARLFREESRSKMESALGKGFERRGWEPLPELGEPTPSSMGSEKIGFSYSTSGGRVEATFGIGDEGTWTLTSIQLPKQ